MQEQTDSARLNIYHLTRRDGTAFFLHPFMRRGSFIDLRSDAELAGLYGEEPRVESLTILRNELYRRIDEDVRDWISERRFIPRFLISALVFLLVFLFMALVIHTPIPLVDELLASGGASVMTFILVGRRFEHSRSAGQRRIALRSKVDNVVFSESEFVRDLELVLQRLESVEPTLDSLSGARDVQALWAGSRENAGRVVDLLRQLLAVKPWKRAARELRRGRLSGKTLDTFAEKKTDPAVILLYHELSRGAATSDVPEGT